MSEPRVINPDDSIDAPYALYSCGGTTVSYWEDAAAAIECAHFLDKTGCGPSCQRQHRVSERACKVCIVPGCGGRRAIRSHGWCSMHREQWRRAGAVPARPASPNPWAVVEEMRTAHAEAVGG
ncbi:hypothetical protein [Spirillospora sp. NPDC048819]|uniref:hypothetical protein n=1 Tax=Spirillospora sp. NPDC048819 TaxID=3155268 RepID=UPI0033E6306C